MLAPAILRTTYSLYKLILTATIMKTDTTS